MRTTTASGWHAEQADDTDDDGSVTSGSQLERMVSVFAPEQRGELIVDGRETVSSIFFEQLNNIYDDRVNYMATLMRSYAGKLNGELRVALTRVQEPFVENALAENLSTWREVYLDPKHVESEGDHNIVLYETVYNRLQYLIDLIGTTRASLASSPAVKDAWLDALHFQLNKLATDFIGLENVKESIGTRVYTFLIYPHTFIGPNYLNFMLQGAPGTGKSTVALVIMQLYYRMGLIFEEPPKELASLDKSDFVAQYQGQSTYRTRELIAKTIGSVIFFDEAYSLIGGKDDQYGYDALNQIVLSLSDFIGLIVFVMAGYQTPIEERLFAVNSGLQRRFSDIYVIRNYKPEVLVSLLEKKLLPLQLTEEQRDEVNDLFSLIYEAGGFAKSNASAVGTIKTLAQRVAFAAVLRERGVTRDIVLLQYDDVLIGIQRYAYMYKSLLVKHGGAAGSGGKEPRQFLPAPPPSSSSPPPPPAGPRPATIPTPTRVPKPQSGPLGRGARVPKPNRRFG